MSEASIGTADVGRKGLKMSQELAGKVAVITGGSSGIGLAKLLPSGSLTRERLSSSRDAAKRISIKLHMKSERMLSQ